MTSLKTWSFLMQWGTPWWVSRLSIANLRRSGSTAEQEKRIYQTYAPSLMISSLYSVHSSSLQGAVAYTE